MKSINVCVGEGGRRASEGVWDRPCCVSGGEPTGPPEEAGTSAKCGWQPGQEGVWGRRDTGMCLLPTRNSHKIVNQLYSNIE